MLSRLVSPFLTSNWYFCELWHITTIFLPSQFRVVKVKKWKKEKKDPLRTTVSNKFLIRPYTLYLMGRILVYNQDFKSDILKMLSQVQKLFIITMFHVKFKILIPCISFYNFLSIRTRRVSVTTYIPICQFNWLCRRLFITDH